MDYLLKIGQCIKISDRPLSSPVPPLREPDRMVENAIAQQRRIQWM